MKIQVTRDHIKRGVAVDCERCPIALALSDIFYDELSVSYETIGEVYVPAVIFIGKKLVISIPLPPSVEDFMDNFDAHQKVRGFSFELPIS